MADHQCPEVPERSKMALVGRVGQANGKWGECGQKWNPQVCNYGGRGVRTKDRIPYELSSRSLSV